MRVAPELGSVLRERTEPRELQESSGVTGQLSGQGTAPLPTPDTPA